MASKPKTKKQKVETTTPRGREVVELEADVLKEYLLQKQKDNHFVYVDGKYIEDVKSVPTETLANAGSLKTNRKLVGA
jgi:hypothetical protein